MFVYTPSDIAAGIILGVVAVLFVVLLVMSWLEDR